MRRPATTFGSWPSVRCSAVACGPPPWSARGPGPSRPAPRILEREALVEAEHQVHVLDGLPGPTFDQVVDGGEQGQGAAAAAGRAEREADLDMVGSPDRRHLRLAAGRA